MYSFRELQKACKLNVKGRKIRLAVLGNCSTQFFSDAIEGYGKLSGLNLNVYDAVYNQIDAQLLDSSSELNSFRPDNILLWLSSAKLYEEFLDSESGQRRGFAELYIRKIEHYWELITKKFRARIIQMNFTEIDDQVLGQYSCKVETTFIYQIRKLNFMLQESMAEHSNVYPVDLAAVQIRLGQNAFYNDPLYYNAKMSVDMKALPYIARPVINVLHAMSGKIKKCVVLDLDNTLWGGVIGDDGLGGIEIGELGKGHVFTNLQRWLKQLKEYGIILAVCSKNEEDIAREPFEKHDEMILRLSDIALFVANWSDKASNIRMIQKTLNIGMDSIVFLDDNPFERNLVREKIPEIEVPELPEDPSLWLSFLQQSGYFNTVTYADESVCRTEQYRAEFERRKLEVTFDSIEDYLENLEMIGEVKQFEPLRYPRIAQLTQRSNQFNLRTVRYTEDEIARIAEDGRYLTLYYTLKDKFGDHGLVSVVIMKKTSEEELFINTWLMSCRVLKRSMEEYIVNCIVREAKRNGFSKIKAEYIPTPKNRMVKDIYRDMGFAEIGEGQYFVNVDEYKEQKTFVKEDGSNGEK